MVAVPAPGPSFVRADATAVLPRPLPPVLGPNDTDRCGMPVTDTVPPPMRTSRAISGLACGPIRSQTVGSSSSAKAGP